MADNGSDLDEWDKIADRTTITLEKRDLDTIYIAFTQLALALLAGDAEMRALISSDQKRADENWERKLQALKDNREALKRLLLRIAERTTGGESGHEPS